MSARTTWALAGLLAALIAADVGVRLAGTAEPETAPSLPAFAVEEPVALSVTWGEERVRIARAEDGWAVVAPFAAPADAALVDGLLAALGRGVPMDARVDAGGHERYGLDGADPVLVEIEGASGPLVRFYVGADTGDGATFVRFPDQEDVYRARLGGRARFARPAAAWRDPFVLRVPPERVVSIGLRRASGELVFARPLDLDSEGVPRPGRWRLEGAPDFAVDQALLDALAESLGGLRALELLSADHPADLDAPVVQVDLQRDDGTLTTLPLGRTALGAFTRLDPEGPVYRLPPQLVDLLAADADAWRDRTLLVVDAPTVLAYEDDAGLAVAELDPRTGTWALVRPANVDADPRRLAQAAAFLSALRVDDLVDPPGEAAFGAARVRIVDAAGAEHLLEVGGPVPGRPAGQEQVYVRASREGAAPRTGVLSARTWAALRSAWAR